jgi:tetratricopeptide (TPR) repeat protein
MQTVWQSTAGLTALIGAITPPPPRHRPVVRIACDRHPQPLGAWLAAGAQARHLLALPPRGVGGAHRFDGMREVDPIGDVVADLNRLHAQHPFTLVFDRIETADGITLDALARVIHRDNWLRAPLILAASEALPRLDGLLRMVQVHGGRVLTADPAPPPEFVLPTDLSWPSRRTLRAAAVMGETVDVALLSTLLDTTELDVLEALQAAADAGVQLEDDGDGHLRLHADLAATLRADTLPSLARHWHRRLAELLSPAAPQQTEAPEPAATTVELVDELPADLTGSWASDVDASDRITEHLLAAGDVAAAVDRLLIAMQESVAVGANEQALALGDQARRHLDALPPTAATRRQRIAQQTAVAHAQHHAVGPQHSLDVARQTIQGAFALLRDDDPPRLRAMTDTLRARILYDQGSPEALEAALAVLTDCSRWLETHGAPREAARLFNDQAAIWVRIGDPVRAHHLLDASRAVFAEHAASDPTARLELAETDHLIARLPLQVAAKDGQASAAVELGLRHARSAEEGYASLDMAWEQARVWETIGRLALQGGNPAAAVDQLETAARQQQALGDALGLAATVEALARAMAVEGRHADALELLRDSLALNAEKGSAQGLARIGETLREFVESLPATPEPALVAAVEGLRADLEAVSQR